MSLPPLTPEVFGLLSAFIEERLGLHYGWSQRELLADKLSVCAVDAGFASLLDYYYFLRYDEGAGAELERLTDALVVGETYLFRELEPLRVLVDDILAPMAAVGRRPRVWSAACATGEEPATLAMLLAERRLLGSVDLVASDVSARALARAREGKFGRRAVRQAPPADLARWVTPHGDGVAIPAELTRTIDYRRVNLVDREAIVALGRFDAVICRNVLIYFRDETARDVIHSLTSVLRSEGALLVGVSESLLRFGTTLRWEERRGVFLYRKAEP